MAEVWENLAKDLANEIFILFKQSAKDYVKEQGVENFLKETATRYAKWKAKALFESDPVRKAEYEENLKDVTAQVDMEIARHAIVASRETINFLISIAKLAGEMLIKIAPKLIGLPI